MCILLGSELTPSIVLPLKFGVTPTLFTSGTTKECGEILTPTMILWFLPKEQRSNRPNGHGKITNFGN